MKIYMILLLHLQYTNKLFSEKFQHQQSNHQKKEIFYTKKKYL